MIYLINMIRGKKQAEIQINRVIRKHREWRIFSNISELWWAYGRIVD